MRASASGPVEVERETLHSLVRAQIRRTPTAVAVEHRTRQLTYGELGARSEAVAQRLAAAGVAPGDLVGICSSRSEGLVPAVLGTLEAGAAYVPLDPAYPVERLRLMARDSGVAVVLGDSTGVDLGPGTDTGAPGPRWLDVEGRPRTPSPEPVPPVRGRAPAGPADLAYVLYTSGSTGIPKGVAIEHRNAVNLVRWAGEAFTASQRRRVVASTSLSWDLSIFELFGTLAWGGTVVLVRDALALVEAGAPVDVTLMNTVPTVMARLLERGALPRSVEVVTLAGEALHGDTVRALHATNPGLQVWNLYGPTETTTFSTGQVLDPGTTGPAPIGKPLRGTVVHLLDDDLREVAPGEEGEICIGGSGVARGYLDRPSQTADRFVDGPVGAGAPVRLYRTGDRGRRDAEGTLWYLGRTDDQVKVRGLRIELGEVDAALRSLDDVTAAATVVAADPGGGRRLAAFVTIAAGAASTGRQLRDRLHRVLPPHMVPATVVVLDSLPSTPNGKVDRAGLVARAATASPDIDLRTLATDGGDPVEAAVAATFEAVCGTAPTSPDDDFFEIGGDSLSALDLVEHLDRTLGLTYPLSLLLERSTVSQITDVARRTPPGERPSTHVAGLVPLRTGGDLEPLFLGPLLGGGLRMYRDLVAHLDPHRPVFGLQAPGLDGESPPLRSVAAMARFFAAEVLARRPEGPLVLGGFSYGATVALETARQLVAEGHEVALVVVLDTDPFDRRPRWTAAPGDRLRRELDDLSAARARHELAATLRARAANAPVRVALRFRAPEVARPSDARTLPAADLRSVHRRAAAVHDPGPMPFPMTILERPESSRFDAARVARDRRAQGPVEHHLLPARGIDHTAFLVEPNVVDVARIVDDAIAKATGAAGAGPPTTAQAFAY